MSPRDETVSPTPPPPYPIYLPPPSLLPYQLVNFVCLWSVSDAAYQGDSPTQTYDGIFLESEKIYWQLHGPLDPGSPLTPLWPGGPRGPFVG